MLVKLNDYSYTVLLPSQQVMSQLKWAINTLLLNQELVYKQQEIHNYRCSSSTNYALEFTQN